MNAPRPIPEPLKPFVVSLDSQGYYLQGDTEVYETLEELICGLFGFCGCGQPEEVIDFIHKGLKFVRGQQSDKLAFDEWKAGSPVTNCWKSRGIEDTFGAGDVALFFLYWADKEELIDHSISLSAGGFLTDYGEKVLALIEYYFDEKD